MEVKKSITSITSRTNENINVHLHQKNLEEFSNFNSQRLRERVKAIKLEKDKLFLEAYFRDYDKSSEGIKEYGEIE